ncbi:hypothetical protein DAEQUDRAFT_706500 [Daedalea quercina L-15889]|uniref:Protein kinase domain-containing protein n=1 Tax=Daedalea quercina L-15889 TaxID=1314783 RepID=A0A165SBC9_9APHY|nr:hypothetical protein DAEQUDRAFT_706500 [Daedalea quercina L-15889]
MPRSAEQRTGALTAPSKRAQLSEGELYWRDRQPWLQGHGYMLRPRYKPDWKPSWEGTNASPMMCEDGQRLLHSLVIDATRLSDGTVVTLKKIDTSVHPYEVEIAQMFCEEPKKSDPRNHCVQVFEVLQDPDDEATSILVMPFLKTYNEPRFQTVGESVEFFRQSLEGLQFMHQNHVAHRDISSLNVMMDPSPLYPVLYHPCDDYMTRDYSKRVKPYTRTERPTKYFFIDFGLSRKYSVENENPSELPIFGGDRSVPEFQGEGYNTASNPFLTDIYYLGNRFREEFLQKYKGLEFMNDLVDAMVVSDPQQRPSIDEVVSRFSAIQCSLSWWKCRQRLVSKKESALGRGFRGVGHLLRTAAYILLRLPAIPAPSMS